MLGLGQATGSNPLKVPQETMMGLQFSAGTVGEGSQIHYSISEKKHIVMANHRPYADSLVAKPFL